MTLRHLEVCLNDAIVSERNRTKETMKEMLQVFQYFSFRKLTKGFKNEKGNSSVSNSSTVASELTKYDLNHFNF